MRTLIWLSAALCLVTIAGGANCQTVYFDRKYDSGLPTPHSEGLGPSLVAMGQGYTFAAITLDNQTITAGLYFVHVDELGNVEYELTSVNDTVSEYYNAMIPIHDGNLMCASTADLLYLTDFDSQAGLTKIDPNGSIIWKRYFGLSSTNEIGQRVIETSDHGYALIGQRQVEQNVNADIYLIRTDSAGNPLWEQQYGGSNFEGGYDLVQTPDSGFLLLGWTRSFGAGQRDFYLVKTDSVGNFEWQRTYGGGGDEIGKSIFRLNDENYLLTGSGSQGSASSIGRIYKVNSNGDVLWSKTYGYSNNSGNNLHRTVELWNGDLVSVGMTNNLSNSGWLVRTDSLGNLLWQREYDYNNNTDLFYTLIATSDGGFLLGGQAKHEFPLTQDAWLLKVDSVGCPYPNCLVGVDEVEKSRVVVDVWPNPTASFLNIEWQRTERAKISLFDLSGREVISLNGGLATIEQIDVSQLPNGLYVLKLVQGSSVVSLKIVVE